LWAFVALFFPKIKKIPHSGSPTNAAPRKTPCGNRIRPPKKKAAKRTNPDPFPNFAPPTIQRFPTSHFVLAAFLEAPYRGVSFFGGLAPAFCNQTIG